jgi:hypothetical protein
MRSTPDWHSARQGENRKKRPSLFQVPLNSFLHYNEGFVPFMKMVFTLAYIIFGEKKMTKTI